MVLLIPAAGDITNLLPVIGFIVAWAIIASLAQKKKPRGAPPPAGGRDGTDGPSGFDIIRDMLRGEPPAAPPAPPGQRQPPARRQSSVPRRRQGPPSARPRPPTRSAAAVKPPPLPPEPRAQALSEDISAMPLSTSAPATEITASAGAVPVPQGVPRGAAVREAIRSSNLRTQMAIVELLGPPVTLR